MRFTRNGLITAVLVVAALFVGSFVAERMPRPEGYLTEQPFIHEGEIGQTVVLRTGEVSVVGVYAAKTVELFLDVSESADVWLVVDVRWTPLGEPHLIGGSTAAIAASDGRTFGGSQPVNNICGRTQPGLTVGCQMAFEISADALEGAQILLPAESSVRTGDGVAQIDLGIDAATAAEWAETDAHITLLESTVMAP